MTAVDAVTGASLPMSANSLIRNGTSTSAITALHSDGQTVFAGSAGDGVFKSSDGGASWAPMQARRSVADIRDTVPALSGDELMGLVRRTLAPRLDGRGWRVAVVVASPAQYGKARQFDAMADWLVETKIFDDVDAALAWVREKEPPPAS